jgi:hypothetical protein
MSLAYTNREVFLKGRVSEPRQRRTAMSRWTLGLAIVLRPPCRRPGVTPETTDHNEQISVVDMNSVASFGAPVSPWIARCARARRPSSQESIVSGAAADGSRDRSFTCFIWMTNDGNHSLT